ncbi:hypothetical protein EJB05_32590 [Eragrostis curvula]|uniref:GDSL esterase/lipase n=1 Tax=Eragrostis curvula TaxID=38414 RepID=A0A5J9UGI9_9POAL|nr:hypothetical protein EJB05_32590 [Eragrostis curvula]
MRQAGFGLLGSRFCGCCDFRGSRPMISLIFHPFCGLWFVILARSSGGGAHLSQNEDCFANNIVLKYLICKPLILTFSNILGSRNFFPIRLLHPASFDSEASPTAMMKLLCFLSVLLLASVAENVSALPAGRRYEAIFSFGDSFADTGNDIVVLAEHSIFNPAAAPPYGMTFFGHPTGRNSNGRLIIDFIAEDLGLPFVPPFLAHNGSFRQGANFAVAGAFARSASFYSNLPIVECRGFFHKSLFFMGEYGVNDYSFSVFGMNVSEIRLFVPDVINTISMAAERIIKQGGKSVVMPGIPPLGCSPTNLALLPSDDPNNYDATGCLKQLNDLSVYHNSLLQEAVNKVQTKYPNVRVIYADFYTPVMDIIECPDKLGFTKDILRCCCGGGGKYNFNMSAGCGMPGSTEQKPSDEATMRRAVLRLQIFLLLCSFCYSIQSNYTSILSFGDSYTDTGNLAILYGPASTDFLISKPPYGMTFFGHPTGRASDGRLVIDFIAEALGLPLLPPSLAANKSFTQGVNFATGGATALNRTFFVDRGFKAVSPFNVSISFQLGWFDSVKPSLCNSTQDCIHVLLSSVECKECFAKTLFFVGELGWNDYAIMLLGGTSVDEVRSHVPEIVKSICAATEKLINEGAKTVVVSGIAPLGCAPANLAFLSNQTGGELEPNTGCLKDLNLVSKDHNQQLRRALMLLGGRYPGVQVIYADFYAPIIDFAVSPDRYGFNGTDGVLRASCGGGGDLTALCGMPGVSAGNPSAHVSWDGVHLTEAANHFIADGWLRGPYAHPPILGTY